MCACVFFCLFWLKDERNLGVVTLRSVWYLLLCTFDRIALMGGRVQFTSQPLDFRAATSIVVK